MLPESAEPGPFIIDEKSFRVLYECYWEKVYAVCYNHVRQVEIAQGMVQDIFRSLWERRDTLEITTSPEKYLVRSAKFKVFEYIRNTQTRKEHFEKAMSGYTGYIHATEHEVVYNNLKGQVDTLVDSLPDKCRRVFRMSREEGLTNKEIANKLGITERAIEYHIARALTTLRLHLNDYLS
jgi:RNA polymerase sigma-70 factor (family 1)